MMKAIFVVIALIASVCTEAMDLSTVGSIHNDNNKHKSRLVIPKKLPVIKICDHKKEAVGKQLFKLQTRLVFSDIAISWESEIDPFGPEDQLIAFFSKKFATGCVSLQKMVDFLRREFERKHFDGEECLWPSFNKKFTAALGLALLKGGYDDYDSESDDETEFFEKKDPNQDIIEFRKNFRVPGGKNLFPSFDENCLDNTNDTDEKK